MMGAGELSRTAAPLEDCVAQDPRDAPMYNIKAVARLTGVAADTLRRWESRYQIMAPQRTPGGYRMYSQHDVDTIRWLTARLAEGLTISRACELLRQQGPLVASTSAPSPTPAPPSTLAPPPGVGARPLPGLLAELLDAYRDVNEGQANAVITEALALYSVEQVVNELIYPSLIEVGNRWLRQEFTVAQEHFASALVRGRLANLFHSSPYYADGALILVACAPGELHEIGAQVLALFLRRSGYRVVYLGQNVPEESLVSMIRTLRPALVCCSASRSETAAALRFLPAAVAQMRAELGWAPLLAFGGAILNRYPELAPKLGAVYLGPDATTALARVAALLAGEGRVAGSE
jgi:DNA-binding transcriptional MerR regulator/methylmalonyl-CoA mutase cobalamin-binding subunit